MEQLLKILGEIHPEINFEQANNLIDDGLLDSFDIVTLVGEIDDAFDIQIGVEDLLPENFNSTSAMLNLIERLQNE
ncbi:D-alanine--poly(phosphoribitol) ligase subunit 2 [bioreactor metagenome]|uniref:D-alanine--poly(Phosphoribitol) ligase subunit 2 n=1 Tax=bioreactor metagenome TaxID=1076179 RepID=A0A644XE78_9ZZZZ